MLSDIGAMILGTQQGKKELAGVMPSDVNAGGAPANNMDPAEMAFRQAHESLNMLSTQLMRLRQEDDANRIAKLAVQCKEIQISRAKAIADRMSEEMLTGQAQNAMAPVQGLNAMGVPQGGM